MVGAGQRGPPPPPPILRGEGIVLLDGPHLDEPRQAQRPQQQQQQQQRPQQQQQQQQQQQRPQMMQQQRPPQFARNPQVVNAYGSSARVSDIRPTPQLTEAFARQKLTVYEVYTLRKAESLPDFKEFQEERRDSKGSKKSMKPKLSWGRIVITRDAFDQADIIKKIRGLEKYGRSVTTKKKDLSPNQHIQVTKLLDEKSSNEFDPSFAWTLAQLESKIVTNRTTGSKETETMTLYLKRAPHEGLDALGLFQKIEMIKMMANRPPQQMEKGMGQDGQPGQAKKPGGNVGPPKGVQGGYGMAGFGKGNKERDPIIEIIDERDTRRGDKSPHSPKSPLRGDNKKKYHHDSDSSDYSLSDSDSDRSYSDTETTISSSRSGHRRRDSGYGRRYREREPSKHHEKDYVIVEKGRRRSSTIAYAPDAPRNGPRAPSYERTSIGVDPVAEAFAAGIVAATKVAVADRESMASPRSIMYPRDDRSHGSYEDSLRGLRDMRIRDDMSLHDDSVRGFSDTRDDYFRDDLRRDDLLRREEMRMREVDAEERMRRDSLSISPRTRFIPMDQLRRGSMSQLPLDAERAYNYMRNPMAPSIRRRDSLRDRMEYRGYN